MAEEMFAAFVRLGLDVDPYIKNLIRAQQETESATKSMDKAADTSGGALAAGLKKAAVAAGGLLTFNQVKKAVLAADEAFREQVKSLQAVNQEYDEGSALIRVYSDDVAEAAGLSETEWNRAAVSISNALDGVFESERQVANEAIRLTERAADAGTQIGGDTLTAVEDFNAALGGSLDRLRDYGIFVDKAAVADRARALGLEDVNDEISVQAEKLAVLDIIYEQTADSLGSFDRSGESLTRQAERADALAEAGRALQPIMEELRDASDDLVTVGARVVEFLADATTHTMALLGSQEALAAIRTDEAIENLADETERLAKAERDLLDVRNETARQAAEIEATEARQAALDALADSLQHLVKDAPSISKSMSSLFALLPGGNLFEGFSDDTVDVADAMLTFRDSIDQVAEASGLGAEEIAAAFNAILTEGDNLADWQQTVFRNAMLDAILDMDLSEQQVLDLINAFDLMPTALERGIDPLQGVTDATARARAEHAAAELANDKYRESALETINVEKEMARTRELGVIKSNKGVAESYRGIEEAVRSAQRAQAEAASPLLALLGANERLEDAQDRLNEVTSEHGELSDEAVSAAADVIRAREDFEVAQINASGAVEDGIVQLQNMATETNITDQQLQTLEETLIRISQMDKDLGTFIIGLDVPMNVLPTVFDDPVAPAPLSDVELSGGSGGFVPQSITNNNTNTVVVEGTGDTADDVAAVMGDFGIVEILEGGTTLRGT